MSHWKFESSLQAIFIWRRYYYCRGKIQICVVVFFKFCLKRCVYFFTASNLVAARSFIQAKQKDCSFWEPTPFVDER